MALVFLVLVLMGLFFLGIVAHWNKMATSRTQVTIASNLGAASQGSYVSSYEQSIIEKELDGTRQKCIWPGLLFYVTVGVATALFSALGSFTGVLTIAAMAAAVSSTAVQGVSVPPATTTLWGVLLNEDTLLEDRFIEASIGATLPLAVSDTVLVVDKSDFNMNGSKTDAINRLAYMYSKRVWNLPVPTDDSIHSCQPFKDLQTALETLASTLGLTKTYCSNGDAGDPCCVPLEYRRSPDPKKHDCKKDPDQESACTPPLIADQTWPYDDGYCEGSSGLLFSFIGVDDGVADYKMDSPNTLGSHQSPCTSKLVGWDSVKDVFALLWKLHDSRIDISDIDGTPPTDSPRCHWFDKVVVGTCNPPDADFPQGPLFKKADGLMKQPGVDTPTLKGCQYNWGEITCGVGHPDNKGVLDQVRTVEPFLKMKPNSDKDVGGCPQDPGRKFYGLTTDAIQGCADVISKSPQNCALKKLQVVWRAGWDADATGKNWPYWGDEGNMDKTAACLKGEAIPDDAEPFTSSPVAEDKLQCTPVVDGKLFNNPCGCDEVGLDHDKWQTDSFDEMAIRLRQTIREMSGVLKMKCETVNRPVAWAQAVEWVTYLKKMKCDILAWRKIYELWKKDNFAKGDGSTTTDAASTTWCLPPSKPADMDKSENDAITAATGENNPCGSDDNWGKLPSIKACMEWNRDNQSKWSSCIANCDAVKTDPSNCAVDKSFPDTIPNDGCGICMPKQSAKVGKKCQNKCFYDKVVISTHPKVVKFVFNHKEKICPKPVVVDVVYDVAKRGCGNLNKLWDKNLGLTPNACHDLPRSFYAHITGQDQQTMQANFEQDTCCNIAFKKPLKPFSSAHYKHHPDQDKKPNNANGAAFDKCDYWWQFSTLPEKEVDCKPEYTKKKYKTTFWKEKADHNPNKFCNMCAQKWLPNEDLVNLKDTDGNPLQKQKDTLTKVSDMFQTMMIERTKLRAQYLTDVKKKIEAALQSFQDTADAIDKALPDFEDKVTKLCNQIVLPGETEKVYYVWKNQPQGVGSKPTWHAVKVEAAIPGRCGSGTDCFTQRIPWARPYSRYAGLKKCKVLFNSRGIGSVKVWRYDEERNPISAVTDVTIKQPDEPLAACNPSPADPEKEAYISCERCPPFPGRLEDNGACKKAVDSVIPGKAHSVKSEMEYWVTKDGQKPGKVRSNVKIRQK